MSTKLLVLRLSGVMQAWGYDSQYTYRNTGLFPTKSAVLGLCCAAKGLKRGSPEEYQFLKSVSNCAMTAISLPRELSAGNKSWTVNIRRIDDFHTVENTKTATGKKNSNAVITYRQYLCDADFYVLLEIEESIAVDLGNMLSDPVWGVWLGRKSCIPSVPVFAGLFNDIDDFSDSLLDGKSLNHFTYQKEVRSFEEGTDSFLDIPFDYAVDKRERGQRRVKIYEAK